MTARRVLLQRFTRFTAGSVVAFLTSEVTLVVLYGSGALPATAASVAAFFAGAVPNYVLNRQWVWKRRGRIGWRTELLPYAAVSLVSLAAAAAATAWASAAAPGGHTTRTAFVAVAYLATYGSLFLAKFAVYQRVVFADRAEPAAHPPGNQGGQAVTSAAARPATQSASSRA